MQVELAYGKGWLPINLPDERTTVFMPRFHQGLEDEKKAVKTALSDPIGSKPLKELVKSTSKVCIIFTDITRATPNHKLIPWLLEELSIVPSSNIVLLNATGTHRPNTPEELKEMLGENIIKNFRVINHNCKDETSLIEVGKLKDGTPALVNRYVVDCDLRILVGFIEPHFFAGFSGGPKLIMPGCAGLQTIMKNHGFYNLNHPYATFGITHGNPVWEEIKDVALAVGSNFILNVTLNKKRQITGVFAGDMLEAHKAGTEFEKCTAMQRADRLFEIVITTNSGYPLDLNLYQSVKGLSAAARIVKPGGTIILAAECREGIPSPSPLEELLKQSKDPVTLLQKLATPGFEWPEQWQAHILALVQQKAKVIVYSSLPENEITAIHLEPTKDIELTVKSELKRFGADAAIAVLPLGPLTIPYPGLCS